MSVAQWLNNLEWQATSAPRVQGIYSPVAGADGLKRRMPGMGTPEIYFFLDFNVVDNFNRVFQIVEGNQSLHKNEENLRHAERILLAIGDLMKLFHGVVRDVTERAAKKRRNSGHGYRPAVFQQLLK